MSEATTGTILDVNNNNLFVGNKIAVAMKTGNYRPNLMITNITNIKFSDSQAKIFFVDRQWARTNTESYVTAYYDVYSHGYVCNKVIKVV